MQRKIFGLFIVMMTLVFMSCPNPTSDKSDAAITLLEIPGVTAPVSEATPGTTAIDTVQYKGTISWSPADSPFAVSTVYTANIVLTAKSGWTLTGVAANSFMVAGAAATNAVNSGAVTAVFPATKEKTATPDAVVTLLAIPGVIAPVRGAIPATTAIDTTQYTGTISWNPTASTFAATTWYRANIVLTAKTGWTLTGVVANSFTVTSATTTNVENSGAVEAVFKSTSAVNDYDSVNIGILKNIPAGTFQRNSTTGNNSTVSVFRMSQNEITRVQYMAVTMAADPSYILGYTGITDPVQKVTWYDAIEFCNKLSVLEGLTAVYTISGRTPATGYPITAATVTVPDWDATGYRLPTEMEWMWAAMGATYDRFENYTGIGTNIWGYSKEFAGDNGTSSIYSFAWSRVNVHNEKTKPVGELLSNECGLNDMTGNVIEWNWDWYDTYPTGAQTNYRGPASGTFRVAHGGSWNSDALNCNVKYRDINLPYQGDPRRGFRVVRL